MNKIIDLAQLRLLIAAHLKEIIREPAVIFWGIAFPMVMALGLGFAFTKKPDTLRKVAVIENINTTNKSYFLFDSVYSRIGIDNVVFLSDDSLKYQYVINNDKLGKNTFEFAIMSWDKAITQLKQGKISLVIKNSGDSAMFYFDPINPDAQSTYMILSQLTNPGNLSILRDSEKISPLTIPGSRYIDFLIPGLISMGVMMSTMWGLSYGMIERRSKKLLRRMVATPMRKSHFLFSLITVRLLMNIFEAGILILFSWLVFKTTIQGNILALATIFVAGNLAFAGMAIFISSRTAKTEIGNGLINIVVMPMMMLSGIFFSYHNFPDKIVTVIQKLPLTMVADGIRSIFIEGAGFQQIVVPAAILFSLGLVFFIAGLKIFKWY
jgi:ABC-type multidrug transport system permease subunit